MAMSLIRLYIVASIAIDNSYIEKILNCRDTPRTEPTNTAIDSVFLLLDGV